MNVLARTQSICSVCKRVVPAELVEREQGVWLVKRCESHGGGEALISSDAAWYREMCAFGSQPAGASLPAGACRGDCPQVRGLCRAHERPIRLPVVPVTSACNLRCPVCYTLNNHCVPFHMSCAEFAAILRQIRQMDPMQQIINFTGGEPLMHPEFVRLVEMCHEAGIRRITISTNGLCFLQDERLLADLCRLNARIVLSWNSFQARPYLLTAGADLLEDKLRILALLARYKPVTTLLTVVAAGINDQEIGSIVRAVMESDFIVSSEIHTITFTGQNERRMDHALRLTTPDVLRGITAGNPWMRCDDFLPSPCAHPLCYSICYALRLGGGDWVPLARLVSRARLYELLRGQLYLEPGPATEQLFREIIDDLWTREDASLDSGRILKRLRAMMDALFPAQPLDDRERQKRAEQYMKAVYIHSHMDADNLDLARLRQCCVAVPSEDGRFVPTCAYNNFHRARDARFAAPAGEPACATS